MKKLIVSMLIGLFALQSCAVFENDQYKKCTNGAAGYGQKVHKIQGPQRVSY